MMEDPRIVSLNPPFCRRMKAYGLEYLECYGSLDVFRLAHGDPPLDRPVIPFGGAKLIIVAQRNPNGVPVVSYILQSMGGDQHMIGLLAHLGPTQCVTLYQAWMGDSSRVMFPGYVLEREPRKVGTRPATCEITRVHDQSTQANMTQVVIAELAPTGPSSLAMLSCHEGAEPKIQAYLQAQAELEFEGNLQTGVTGGPFVH